ncbi:DUF2218 domain-containing protein [Aureimonas mangrovi]|uniref:DUF2218 domain-containing protein n=1 Tax=Aureimonas mangrovi TaxID=2758041 RepID=UPI00163DABBC|nr:DUF2218 domain-containing protein [Aureimonas mangrovi]
MPTSRAVVPTASASRYLQQLCKHWSHRFDVTFDPQHGAVPFGEGRAAEFFADENALTAEVATPDETSLRQMQDVVADHLKRFAFREELAFDWQPVER